MQSKPTGIIPTMPEYILTIAAACVILSSHTSVKYVAIIDIIYVVSKFGTTTTTIEEQKEKIILIHKKKGLMKYSQLDINIIVIFKMQWLKGCISRLTTGLQQRHLWLQEMEEVEEENRESKEIELDCE